MSARVRVSETFFEPLEQGTKRLNYDGEYTWDALDDLVTFAQFTRREKYQWKSVTFSKVAGWSLY